MRTGHVVRLEIDEKGRAHLRFELPPDTTDEEIAYIQALVPQAQPGLLELLDPDTGEVVFRLRPLVVHLRPATLH